MTLSLAGLGVLFILAAVVGHWLGFAPTIRAVLVAIGIFLIGDAGHGIGILVTITTWLQNITGDITNWIFGVRAPWALFVVLAIILLFDLMPKHSAGKRTTILAAVVALLLLGGVAQFPALNHIPSDVRNGVNNARTSVSMDGR